MPYEDVLLYDKKIMQCLDDIPHWHDLESQVARILLQLQLQQLLLFLHTPYARDEPWGSRYDYSAIVHLRSAMTIIDLHDQLLSNRNSFLCLFRHDALNAALSICYNVSISAEKPGTIYQEPQPTLMANIKHYRSRTTTKKLNRTTKRRSTPIPRKDTHNARRQNHASRHRPTRILLRLRHNRSDQKTSRSHRAIPRRANAISRQSRYHDPKGAGRSR